MNRLSKESSPYLLQHQHNPVDWFPWGEEALEKAKSENKPILISIGYSACHWCHVMEKECFEDNEVAQIMNEHFVNIKVDREERPDVDSIYMEAVQLMNQQGGWPLNCFANPEGKPFYGGTYYPKQNWISVLNQIAKLHNEDPDRVNEYANNLTSKIEEGPLFYKPSENNVSKDQIEQSVGKWSEYFDAKNGGTIRAPKFPLPSSWSFMLRYAHLTQNEKLKNHVFHTLNKMAQGGIYDQVGGGFSRYSVDEKWKVPHFEKMLYDNAQLISLYSEAFASSKNEEYKRVVEESIQFCLDELYEPNAGFYCALDADSEGVEGKYYVWSEEEVHELANPTIKKYFNFFPGEKWEGNYIPLRKTTDEEFCALNSISIPELHRLVEESKQKMKERRSNRIKPGLDNKVITSWNSLFISGLCKASMYLDNFDYLEIAKKSMLTLLNNCFEDENTLYRSVNDKSRIPGFLEDYATTIESLVYLFKADSNEFWLEKARYLTDLTFDQFYNPKLDSFMFNSLFQKDVITNKVEMLDDVIPSANSIMGHNLFELGLLLDNEYYTTTSKKLSQKILDHVYNELPNYTNWGSLLLKQAFPFTEIVVVGDDAKTLLKEANQQFLPNGLVIASTKESALPVFRNRFSEKETSIFVCQEKTCYPPVKNIKDAFKYSYLE